MLHQDECEATPPYYPITAYTMLQEGITTCESLEKERGSERGEPISCFLACQCSFVLITPAAAAPAPPCLAILFFFRGPPPPPPWRPERPSVSDRIDSGSLGVARGHACLGVLPTQRERATQHKYTTHTPPHTTHTLPIPPPRRPLSSQLCFYFSGPAPKKGERAEKSADENA